MFSAGKLREWRGRFFRPVGWPCRPRCTLAELYLQLQRGESVSLHFFRKAKPLPMDNLRKSGVEREPRMILLANSPKLYKLLILGLASMGSIRRAAPEHRLEMNSPA